MKGIYPFNRDAIDPLLLKPSEPWTKASDDSQSDDSDNDEGGDENSQHSDGDNNGKGGKGTVTQTE